MKLGLQTHALLGGTHLYKLYMEVHPPPPPSLTFGILY